MKIEKKKMSYKWKLIEYFFNPFVRVEQALYIYIFLVGHSMTFYF